MTIHTLSGFMMISDPNLPGDPTVAVQSLALRVGVPDSQTTFSYVITSFNPNELPEVDITSNDEFVALNSISVDELINDPNISSETYIGQIVWGGGNVTQVLVIETYSSDEDTIAVFELGGVPLPAINTVADANALDASISLVGAIPPGTPLSAGVSIPWASLPNHTSQPDNPVNGTPGDDVLNGTAGNDLINPGANDGEDVINGSPGDDVVLLTSSQGGDFYTFMYDGLPGPITLTLDWDTGIGEVDKGAAGTDVLVDIFRAANWFTGDGVWFTGTGAGDTFNINLGESTWVGLQGGAGNDVFNITDGEIVRLSYNGAASGITVNLNTGVIQDGDGGTDQLNVAFGSDVRIEIDGSHGNDSILGSGADERFILRGGNDTLDGGGGDDLLRFDQNGSQAVTVNIAAGTATGTWNGVAYSHTFTGIEGVRGSRTDGDSLTGDANANYLDGRGGDDTLNGGAGDDTLVGDTGDDVLNAGDGDDWLFGGAGNDTMNGGAGDDFIELQMNSWDATITYGAAGEATIVSAQGTDIVTGVERLQFWDQTIDLTGSTGPTPGDDVLVGTPGDDLIDGLAGNDSLSGEDGNDTLLGGPGQDSLRGGNGDDFLNPGTTPFGMRDIVYGSAGNDTIAFSDIVPTPGNNGWLGLVYDGFPSGINAVIDGANNTGTITSALGTDTLVDVVNALNWEASLNIFGTASNDSFTVDGGVRETWIGLNGGAGSNTYNITLTGNARIDLNGSWSQTATQGAVVDLAAGTISNNGFGFADTLNVVQNGGTLEIRATYFSDNIVGSGADESFILLGGNDTLDAGAGFDRLRYDRSGVDSVTVDLFAGTATGIWNGNGFTHQISGVEYIRGSRAGNDVMTGDTTDNYFRAYAGDDSLLGYAGEDTLEGGDGNDTLRGGQDRDRLYGGDGDDLLDGSAGTAATEGWGDFIMPGLGSNTILGNMALYNAGNGIDISYGDLGGIGGLTITRGANGMGTTVSNTPGLVNDTFTYAHTIEGSMDDDQFFGSNVAGNHFAVWAGLGGNDTITGGSGDIDILFYRDDQYHGGLNGVSVTFTGVGVGTAIDGFGNTDSFTGIESALGSIFDDVLTGHDGAQWLEGDQGNDTLSGAAGADTLVGGEGNDQLWGGADDDLLRGDEGDDQIGAGAGNDEVWGGDGQDTVFAGAGDDQIGAGAGNDEVWADTGADTIFGGAGDDMLGGGAGDDEIWADIGNDVLFGGGGNDMLGAGAGDDSVWGLDGNDQMFGGGGADLMGGGTGADGVWGMDGNDVLYGGLGDDTLGGGTGDDVVWAGADNDIVYGGLGNDLIAGEAGNDALWAGAGNDTLNGGAGDDTLAGEAGADVLVFTSGSGSDLVLGFDASADLLQLNAGMLGGATTGAQVVSQFASIVGGNTVLSFGGGEVITLNGFTDLGALESAIDIL